MNLVDSVSSFGDTVSLAIDNATDYISGGTMFTDIAEFFKNTFMALKGTITSYAQNLLKNIVESIPGAASLLPESIKNFIYNTQTDSSTTNNISNVSAVPTTTQTTASVLSQNNTINNLKEIDNIQKSPVFATPTNNTINSNTNVSNYMSMPMITRNPSGLNGLDAMTI